VTTFGKIIGGGFPVGAIGGQAGDHRGVHARGRRVPVRHVLRAPVTMAAGKASLEYAAENDVYEHVNRLGRKLRGESPRSARSARPSTPSSAPIRCSRRFSPDAPDDPDACCAGGCRQNPDCDRYDTCPKNGADVARAATDRWERVFWQEMKEGRACSSRPTSSSVSSPLMRTRRKTSRRRLRRTGKRSDR